MRKIIIFTLILLVGVNALPQEKVKKIVKEGVEIIINPLEPVRIEGEPSDLTLEEAFTIDTERDDIAELGFTDIAMLNVDYEGNIYCVNHKSSKDLIFQFDNKGRFLRSFGRKGQGPGELEMSSVNYINTRGEITVNSAGNRKVCIFSNDGSLLKEERFNGSVSYLENGNYLYRKRSRNMEEASEIWMAGLLNKKLQPIVELEKLKTDLPIKIGKINFFSIFNGIYIHPSKKYLYAGEKNGDYEIRIYDHQGNLVRKIQKKYKPVKIPGNEKEQMLNKFNPDIRKKIVIPDAYPPKQYFFIDDQGRLFVLTYEKDSKSGKFIYDIFNCDGILIMRKALSLYMVRNNHLYDLRIKESG